MLRSLEYGESSVLLVKKEPFINPFGNQTELGHARLSYSMVEWARV